jgi:uncharacterized protein YjdB
MCLCFAGAEGFDAGRYTYEELQQIRQQIDDRLAEMDREYAIENADRQIVFPEEEAILFLKQKTQVMPEVIRKTEEAPAQTRLNWTSSNPEAATVANNGKVSATGRGDTVITAMAADNEYIFGSYTLHVVVPVEKITIWGQETPLLLGGKAEEAVGVLGCSIEPEDAYFQDVTWASSDESIVTVNENGVIQAMKPGTAVITATSAETGTEDRPQAQASCTVTVKQAVTGIELSESEMNLFTGGTETLSVNVLPEEADDPTVLFRSSDEEIARVSPDGKITAVSCGECEITCEAADGSGITASCRVTVTKQVEEIQIAEEAIRLDIGETYTMDVVILPEDATNKGLRWASSNVFVARVADGKIEGINQGNCEITCTTTDGSNVSAQVKVRIPTFSVEGTEFTVTEKSGMTIPIKYNKKGEQVLLATGGECFQAKKIKTDQIQITPIAAGTGTLTLSNPKAAEDTVALQITIEDSAVYNENSYPPFDYAKAVTNPEEYIGTTATANGKVLQVNKEEDGAISFMIGTGGEGYTDQVLLIRCEKEMPIEEVKKGQMLTVYGIFYMEASYSDMLAAETEIPAMTAERIAAVE